MIARLRRLFNEFTTKETLHQMWKFGLIGAIGGLINLAILTTLVEVFHAYYLLAASIAIILAGGSNFILNKKITFNHKGKEVHEEG